MFPYPSGDGLHVGHPKGYTATDVVARAKRMMGFNVLRVMGWDSFGLPAERRAERTGEHPSVITARNIATFKSQLKKLGLSYDWTRELATSDPKYYKWTQWIFEVLFERGLAYRAEVPVNFCPALGTVLANEEVHDGKYIETGDPVEKRLMKQWMLRITEYADRLAGGSRRARLAGRHPQGAARLDRQVDRRERRVPGRRAAARGRDHRVHHPARTRCSAAPGSCSRPSTRWSIRSRRRRSAPRSRSIARRSASAASATARPRRPTRRRPACRPARMAINPVNGKQIPIWIADYVLASYGTGAVFACPASDERDHAFATKFGLPIIEVVKGPEGHDVQAAAYTGDGPHVNSRVPRRARQRGGQGQGHRVARGQEARRAEHPLQAARLAVLAPALLGRAVPDLRAARRHRRSWCRRTSCRSRCRRSTSTSRRRDGAAAARAREGLAARTDGAGTRETNTMPQWAGSCWYYLRFLSPQRDDVAWDPAEEKYWMPVDLYVGGNEHAVLHLLYARFWHKVLFDAGFVSTKEPFQRLFHQGMIHKSSLKDPATNKYYGFDEVEEREGKGIDPTTSNLAQLASATWYVKGTNTRLEPKLDKMSKSRLQRRQPRRHGQRVRRGRDADVRAVHGTARGRRGVGDLRGRRHPPVPRPRVAAARDPRGSAVGVHTDTLGDKVAADAPADNKELERTLHAAIKKVTQAVADLRFNTAIAEMMVFVNEATKATAIPRPWFESFVKILAPFAPHVAEELWQRLGHTASIAYEPWPAYDEAKLARDVMTIAVQVMGKLRGQIEVPLDASEATILAAAKADDKVQQFLEGKPIKREIYVKGRLVNLVV